jgi:hypothetical protein
MLGVTVENPGSQIRGNREPAYAKTYISHSMIHIWTMPGWHGQDDTEEEKMVMEPISIDKAMEIAKKKGIKPGRVKGTNGVQFTKGRNPRLEIVNWDEFKATLAKRKLAVYESGGWMKIMKAKRKR